MIDVALVILAVGFALIPLVALFYVIRVKKDEDLQPLEKAASGSVIRRKSGLKRPKVWDDAALWRQERDQKKL